MRKFLVFTAVTVATTFLTLPAQATHHRSRFYSAHGSLALDQTGLAPGRTGKASRQIAFRSGDMATTRATIRISSFEVK
jgi:hypothetical protein